MAQSYYLGRRNIRRFQYADVLADLTAIGVDGYTLPLYSRSNQTPSGIIGHYQWDDTNSVAQPVGIFNLANITSCVCSYVTATGGTLNTELHDDGNAASDPNGNETDATTGWTGSETTITSVSTDPQTGTYHLRCVADEGTNDRAEHSETVVSGQEYQVSMWVRVIVGTDAIFKAWTGITASPSLDILDTAWKQYVFNVTTNATTLLTRTYVAGDSGSAADEIYIDNVSIRKITTGNVVTVADASVFAEGDTIDIWNTTAGTETANGRTITDITVNAITFDGAAVKVRWNDVISKPGTCEIGNRREAGNGGNWVPIGGLRAHWDGGLVLNPSGMNLGQGVRLRMLGNPGATTIPPIMLLVGKWDTVEASASANSGFGFGTYSSSSDEMAAGALMNVAGTWRKGQAAGDKDAPTLTGSAASPTAPATDSDILTAIAFQSYDDATNTVYTATALEGALDGGVGLSAGTTAATFGQGADGPITECYAFAQLGSVGALVATLKTVRVVMVA